MESQDLCMKLLACDTEDEVVETLTEAGYWSDRDSWRYFGDVENNWSTIGNQQSSPYAGLIRNWHTTKRTEVSLGITLVATGSKKSPCFTIADEGEGQTPDSMPDTLLSLAKSNKMRIPFVQGKFNMGGTGVFKFCGEKNLQLVISRRNPAAIRGYSADGSKWSFSVVRREDPERGRRSSVFTYLAPLGKDGSPGQGGVLRFSAQELPIFPEFTSSGRNPYARTAKWGTVIKLYEYALPAGGRSNILMGDGLMRRLDLLLPDTALPIRFYEGRAFGGKAGSSFANTLTGLSVRLDDDKTNNLEEGFPSTCPLRADDEEMIATIYAFKKGKAKTYRRDEGIIFTQNGQTHGHLTPDFFRRTKRVGLSYLADSLLVVVDCSKFRGRAREDLFMNSRDRLSKGNLRAAVEHELEDMLKNHSGLRALRERRRREETEARLADSKPFEEILDNILKQAPSLAKLFLPGSRASNPFKTKEVVEQEQEFDGKRFPSFFKFKGKEYGSELRRETHKNMRSRISFETDVVNDFFKRPMEAGEFALYQLTGDSKHQTSTFTGPNLYNGIATLSVKLPEPANVGDQIFFEAVVTDPYNDREFVNRFSVLVKEESPPSGASSGRRKPPGKKDGKGCQQEAGIVLPKIIEVFESEWVNHDFDKFTALKIKDAGDTNGEGNGDSPTQYDFFINMDNFYLKTEKASEERRDCPKRKIQMGYGIDGVGAASPARRGLKASRRGGR